MKLITSLFLLLITTLSAFSQTSISGKVTDASGESLIGANVYVKDTYDGATTDVSGGFTFETYENGEQTLVVSFVGYETVERLIDISKIGETTIVLKEAFNALEAVTISAGSFEAGDENKAVVLKSLDVAMTAGATADIPAALNTFSGTQKNGESGRLFVRGGTADETKVFIDGMEAANFYGTTGPAVPSRSRFSPFLFKGTFFSTGGYSAEYGQALSSTLILTSLDVEPSSQIDLSVMTVGVDASVTKSWDNQSIYAKLGYLNLNPYNNLISQRVKWHKSTVSPDATFSYKRDFEDGTKLRSMVMASTSSFSMERPTNLNARGYDAIKMRNDFAFGTVSVEKPVGDKDIYYIGSSVTHNYDRTSFNTQQSAKPVTNFHLKAKYNHAFGERTFLNTGAEVFHKSYQETLTDSLSLDLKFDQTRPVFFAELDHYLSNSWVIRGGVRAEYEDYQRTFNWAPRLSVAYKLTDYDQLSFATGLFYQDASEAYQRFTDELEMESAAHYILNYQHIKEDRIFRVEGYLKDYDGLVKYGDAYDPATFSNDGDGYAYGVDVFWRDQSAFKFIDYWVSYSWLKSERDFQNYPTQATPGFASKHNLSLVTKKWLPRFNTQVGATYSITSGRPYDNPAESGFNESKTPLYQDLSFNMAWLPTQNVIVYLSASNLPGQKQVFGYDYSDQPTVDGNYLRDTVRLPARRFLFLACFITIGGKNTQLQNL